MWSYAVLASVSRRYPPVQGRLFTCYSPVRHSGIATLVRLAWVRHAASVRPEPGSNSHVQSLTLIPLGILINSKDSRSSLSSPFFHSTIRFSRSVSPFYRRGFMLHCFVRKVNWNFIFLSVEPSWPTAFSSAELQYSICA